METHQSVCPVPIKMVQRAKWSVRGEKVGSVEFKDNFDFYLTFIPTVLEKGLLSSVEFVFSKEKGEGEFLVWKVVRVQRCSPKCQQRVEVISSCGLLTPAFAQNISKYINIFQISFQDISNISTNSKYFQCNLVSTLALEPTSLQDIVGPIFCAFKVKIPRSSVCSQALDAERNVSKINFNSTTELPSGFRTHPCSRTILPGN